jgi:hypothetical protein
MGGAAAVGRGGAGGTGDGGLGLTGGFRLRASEVPPMAGTAAIGAVVHLLA